MNKTSLTNHYTVIIIAITSLLITIAMGINIVLFPVILKENNISEFYIGFSAVIDLLAGILIAPYLGHISRKIPITRFTIIFLITYSIIILVIPFFIHYLVWLFYMVILGIFWFSFFTINNTILNHSISNKYRSLIISLNTTIICIGITIGSALVKIYGSNNYLLYIICSLCTITTAIIFITTLSKITITIPETINNKISYFLKKRPDIFLGKFFQEYITTTIFVFIVIYGINNGISAENAALIISFYTLSTIFDILIGYLSDQIRPLRLLNHSIISATIIMFCIYYFADQYYILLLLAFLLGITIGYMYINCNSALNSYFSKKELINANSCYAMSGSFGGIFASLITGFLLQYFGNIGIFLPVMFISICYFLIIRTKSS